MSAHERADIEYEIFALCCAIASAARNERHHAGNRDLLPRIVCRDLPIG